MDPEDEDLNVHTKLELSVEEFNDPEVKIELDPLPVERSPDSKHPMVRILTNVLEDLETDIKTEKDS